VGPGWQTKALAELPEAFHGTQEEGLADGGKAGPLDEFLEELLGGFLPGLVEAFFLDLDAAGVEVAAAEADDVLGEETEGFASFFKFGRGLGLPVHRGLGVVEGEEAEKGIGKAIGGPGEIAGVGGQFAGLLEELLVAEPFAVAALFPFGEVLGADGAAAEVVGEDGLNFGDFVEPFGDLDGGLASIEELIGFFAKGTGQMGDFAFAFGVGVGRERLRERIHG